MNLNNQPSSIDNYTNTTNQLNFQHTHTPFTSIFNQSCQQRQANETQIIQCSKLDTKTTPNIFIAVQKDNKLTHQKKVPVISTRAHTNRCSTILETVEQQSKSFENSNTKVQIEYNNDELQFMRSLLDLKSYNEDGTSLNIKETQTDSQSYYGTTIMKQINLNNDLTINQSRLKREFLKVKIEKNKENIDSNDFGLKCQKQQDQFKINTNRNNLSQKIQKISRRESCNTLKSRGLILTKNISIAHLIQTKDEKYKRKGIKLFSSEKTKRDDEEIKNNSNSKEKMRLHITNKSNNQSKPKIIRKPINLIQKSTQKKMIKQDNTSEQFIQKKLDQSNGKKKSSINPSTYFMKRRINL